MINLKYKYQKQTLHLLSTHIKKWKKMSKIVELRIFMCYNTVAI